MYRRPELYDAIYSWKDYQKEAELIREIIGRTSEVPGKRLLDIACGTGKHIEHLKAGYECEGLDLSPNLLEAAYRRNPECLFTEGDMQTFNLGRTFDVVICLFSAIGYVRTYDALEASFKQFALHTNPGGVAIVEPWLFPDHFRHGHLGFDSVNLPDYKVARMSMGERIGKISVLNFHFMLGTPNGIETWNDRSELGLFSPAEYGQAMEDAGFEVEFEEPGLDGRGLFIGTKRN